MHHKYEAAFLSESLSMHQHSATV